MMPFYLLMLTGVAAGYYAGVGILKWRESQEGGLLPIATAVVGGMLGYWVALSIAPPIPTGDIVWAESVRQVLNQEELDTVLAENTENPTLIDFYADWCAPCHIEAPDLNEMADAGHRIVVVHVDRSPDLMERYDVSGLPTALIFLGDKEIHRAFGLHSKRALEKLMSASTGS